MKINLVRPICFFDLETTGINISKDRTIEKESFKSLFGLTLEVEKEIIFSIENNKKNWQ